LRDRGLVSGVVTDVRLASVEALATPPSTPGAVHLLCNNAGWALGRGAGVDHTINDWRWALDVNVWGVIHGIKAFVPAMIAGGEQGHVVNTSSGNGGIAPLPGTPIYALTKSAVVTLSESLYAQLAAVGARVGASVLFPGPHMLRTRLFESWRNRPRPGQHRPADAAHHHRVVREAHGRRRG
jgi:NAD(P)-dependent dehydrogenase (short-subunit alcohol dehydrogenase family)